jgi:hypothetical protein
MVLLTHEFCSESKMAWRQLGRHQITWLLSDAVDHHSGASRRGSKQWPGASSSCG